MYLGQAAESVDEIFQTMMKHHYGFRTESERAKEQIAEHEKIIKEMYSSYRQDLKCFAAHAAQMRGITAAMDNDVEIITRFRDNVQRNTAQGHQAPQIVPLQPKAPQNIPHHPLWNDVACAPRCSDCGILLSPRIERLIRPTTA